MSVPVIRGLTPIIERLPLFGETLRNVRHFAESQGLELLEIEVVKRDYSQALIRWEVALIGTVADGRRYGVQFPAGLEHIWRARMTLASEADQRRKAWHDWQN